MRQRLLLLSLDGLSLAQADSLHIDFGDNAPLRLTHYPLVSAQAVWAEILWGRSWSDLGVATYARPQKSLNEVVPWQEDQLPEPCRLLNSRHKNITINLPLLIPQENRVWLSDGSLPLASVVSPDDIYKLPGLNKYRPRPFSCTASAAARLPQAVSACLDMERQRLECASELLSAINWHTGIIRLTAFDLLSHLLGADFISDKELRMREELESFLQSLRTWLDWLRKKFPDAVFGILSTVGHTQCRARINLNQLLWQGGFCELLTTEQFYEPVVLNRRQAATQFRESLMKEFTDLDETEIAGERQALPVSSCWMLDSAKTLCASPVQGGVYLNLKSRFEDGVVDPVNAPGVLNKVRDFISKSITTELGVIPEIWQSEQIGLRGPELMVYADGVEFHNTRCRSAIDQINKPRSTHTAEGFVWLSPGFDQGKSKLTPLELHAQLMGVGNG